MPISRRKRRSGGTGSCCSSRADDLHAAAIADGVRFFAPDVAVLPFPAWDCLPYDRVSPKSDTESERLATLAALARRTKDSGPAVVVTTINAVLQRVPPRAAIEGASFFARTGANVGYDKLTAFLAANGYAQASTVREPGDFALRGGIVDLWPPGSEQPLRLDFFGTTLDAIRRFDAETQLSADKIDSVELLPASEAPLDPASISRFRAGYVARFGPATSDDPLYEAVSAGRKQQGMEHWLPLFHDHLDTLFDFVPDALILLAHQTRGSEDRAAGTDRGLLRDAQGDARPQARTTQARDQGAALQAAAAGGALSDRQGMGRVAVLSSRARSLAVPGAGSR